MDHQRFTTDVSHRDIRLRTKAPDPAQPLLSYRLDYETRSREYDNDISD